MCKYGLVKLIIFFNYPTVHSFALFILLYVLDELCTHFNMCIQFHIKPLSSEIVMLHKRSIIVRYQLSTSSCHYRIKRSIRRSARICRPYLMRMYVEADETECAELKSVFSANILSHHATTKTNKLLFGEEPCHIHRPGGESTGKEPSYFCTLGGEPFGPVPRPHDRKGDYIFHS